MRKAFVLTCTVVGILSALALPVFAGQQLTGEELKKLITGKTLYVYIEKIGKVSVIYEAPDGSHNVVTANGQRHTGKWWINDAGLHCVESPGLTGCYPIFNNDGVYQKMDNGVITHTIKEIRDGDTR